MVEDIFFRHYFINLTQFIEWEDGSIGIREISV